MDTIILAFLSGLFGLFCIGREVCVIFRAKQIRISNLFLIMYGTTYGVVLSLWLYLAERDIYVFRGINLWFDYSPEGIALTARWFCAAVVGYCAFRIVSVECGGAQKRKFVYAPATSDAPNPLLLERLQITGVICLAIGIISFFIWVYGWGGYLNLFLHAPEIRNGSYGIRNPVAFFAKPAQVVAVTTLIFLLLIKQGKNSRFNIGGMIVSVIFSLLYYLAKDGRMSMTTFLLVVLFLWNDMFDKQVFISKYLIKLAFFFVFFVAFVLNMDAMTAFLRDDVSVASGDKTIIESIFLELSYIYVTGQISVGHCIEHGSPMLIAHDVGLALFAWIPSAFTPKGLIDLWDYNTYLIAGSKAPAQYPCDLISASLYDLGILGPIVMPAFWGWAIKKLEEIYEKRRTPLLIIVYCSLSLHVVRVVNYSMFCATTANLFFVFLFVVIFKLVGNTKWN